MRREESWKQRRGGAAGSVAWHVAGGTKRHGRTERKARGYTTHGAPSDTKLHQTEHTTTTHTEGGRGAALLVLRAELTWLPTAPCLPTRRKEAGLRNCPAATR